MKNKYLTFKLAAVRQNILDGKYVDKITHPHIVSINQGYYTSRIRIHIDFEYNINITFDLVISFWGGEKKRILINTQKIILMIVLYIIRCGMHCKRNIK